jgi:3-oxoacyl-[acyl-carrier protein] reductase
MHNLTGQIAIVTGGTRGIGAAISRSLLEAGARVIATYLKNEDEARGFSQACEPFAERLLLRSFDVADPEAVQHFFADVQGPLHILVNNAGVRRDALVGMMSRESWDRVIAVNLSGAFFMCKHAVRAMLGQRYGRIVNIISPSGSRGVPGQANYAAAKAGLVGLTRCLAQEVAMKGITVNCVCPGFVLTDMLRDLPEEKLAALRAEVPLKRFGLPEEIAAAVLFLVSQEATYITGATLPVTGGV